MASASLVPANGACTITGFVADFASLSPNSQQSVEEVTPYGANTMAKRRGSGTPTLDVAVGGFQLKGAASTTPPLVTMSSTGAACVFTLDTSCTLTGNFVFSNFQLTHARMRAAVPFTLNVSNADDITLAWVTS
jgi:hypothetical protein